jgi:hypothetical protein
MNGAVEGYEFLQPSHPHEPEHACSRLRNSWWEFSARLFSLRPTSRLLMAPICFNATPYDAKRSVTIVSTEPCLRSDCRKHFNAAFLSRRFVTKLSSTSPA